MPWRITITYLIDTLQIGGTQEFLSLLSKGLRYRSYRQQVICLNQADRCVLDRLTAQAVAVEQWGAWQYPSMVALCRLVKLLRREGTDIVQTMLPYADALGRCAGRLAGTHVVVSAIRVHKTAFQLRLNRLTVQCADRLTVNAEALKQFTVDYEGARQDRIITIHNSIDLNAFAAVERQQVRQQLGILDG